MDDNGRQTMQKITSETAWFAFRFLRHDCRHHGRHLSKYRCSGCTALNDAVCTAIDTLGEEFSLMKEEDRPEHVMFVIITDGMENASRKFSSADVKKRIQEQTDVYKWDFQYLAANQDAFASGEMLGVSHDNCVNWHASKDGIASVCGKMAAFATKIRA